MKRCNKCGMASTRPGIKFDESGTCYPCLYHEKRKSVDWERRWKELEQLCNLYRKNDGSYDCLLTCSGGKDSHAQAKLLNEDLGMHPLGFMIDNGRSWTETGRDNYYNLSEKFDLDILMFTPSVKKMKEACRKGFLENLWPEQYWDSLLYEKPMEIAQKMGIELVFWGEDTSAETGGAEHEETPNALKQSSREVRIQYSNLNVIFLSYYVNWNRYDNLKVAKEYGFKDLDDTREWNRDGYQGFPFEQVDTIGYLTNNFCKFIKFGFGSQTELCSDAVRQGKMTRETAIQMINKYDWRLDEIMLDDFCKGIGISRFQFWQTVSTFANKDLLEIREGNWRLKNDAI